MGPDAKGKCQATFECLPKDDGDGKFVCTRAPQFGGRCTEGPLPDGVCSHKIEVCNPVRTHRAKRALLVSGFVAFCVAWVFVLISMPEQRSAVISPGELTSQHSSLETSCTTCHENSEGGPLQWLTNTKMQRATSAKCLSCHALDANHAMPHGVPSKSFTRAEIAGRLPAHLKTLDCTQCHTEHHGKNADIKFITSQQCNTCHETKVESFAKNHPEFTNFPFDRRTRLNFDHNSHFSQHFGESERKQISCQSCHVPDSQGRKMVINSFEKSCASCHGNKVHGVDSIAKGYAAFSLPLLDIETLGQKGIRVGEWPEYADSAMTPLHKAMLQVTEHVTDELDVIAELDLADLTEASRKELKAVEKVIWATKHLILSLESGEAGKWAEHLAEMHGKLHGSEPSLAGMSQLSAGLPVEVWRAVANRWLPNLKKEVAGFNKGQLAPSQFSKVKPASDTDVDRMAHGGWYLDEADFTIRYRPKGHADVFLRTWIDFAVNEAGKESIKGKLFASLTNSDSAPGQCMECHTADQVGDRTLVNWHGEGKGKAGVDFHRFSHVDHFSLLSKDGCFTCHERDTKSEYQEHMTGFDYTKYNSNFKPIAKDVCSKCHNSKKVKSDCLTCHNYHAERMGLSSFSANGIHWLKGDPNPTPAPEAKSEAGDATEENSEADEAETDEAETEVEADAEVEA